ncbi:MAG TPA: hypothetical protein VGO89_00745 [Streptomyces sp.]|jgi:hypothetical protein|nr:hypothetical protein [Streptomyces sp.]
MTEGRTSARRSSWDLVERSMIHSGNPRGAACAAYRRHVEAVRKLCLVRRANR